MRRRIAGVIVAAVVALAVAGPLFAPHPPGTPIDIPYAPAGGRVPLGTDYVGADVLSRVLSGGRTIVALGVVALVLAYALGATAGMLAALLRGRTETLIMRLADVLMSMPGLLLLSVVIVATGRGPGGVAVATVVVLLPEIVRMVRAATAQALAHDYVEAAVARGESTRHILVREVLPNLKPTIAADAGVRLVGALYLIATASFLGYGVQPPTADWGLMILENRDGIGLQPLAVAAPAGLLLVLLLSANLLFDSTPRARPRRRARLPRAQAPAEPGPAGWTGARGLSISTRHGTPIVRGIDLTLGPAQVTAVVGESGSGKTTIALALLGHYNPGLHRTAGRVFLDGHDLSALTARRLRKLRAAGAAYVAQDPRTALCPVLRVADHIDEALRARGVARGDRPGRISEALALVRLPDDPAFLRRRPHQLSGGQRQRLALAAALAHRPRLVVLDEPTSALDPVNAAAFLADVRRLCDRTRAGVLLISHDLASVSGLADTVVILDGGRIAEYGPADKVLREPTSDTGRALLDAVRPRAPACPDPPSNGAPVLAATGLQLACPPLAGVDLAVAAGGLLSIVGPSGGGKTTLLRCLAGLRCAEAGDIRLHGRALAAEVRRRPVADRRLIQLVPQNPDDSLNPAHTVAQIIARPIRLFGSVPPADAQIEVVRLLARVGLTGAYAARRPGSLSGGQRQRVALARALAARPDVLLCDEATSALDPTVAAAIVDLLGELRADLGMALVVVTHDLSLVRRLGGEILVMAEGRIVERGDATVVLGDPAHPLTRGLVEAVPLLP